LRGKRDATIIGPARESRATDDGVKIGVFYELQTPRPWRPESEHAVIKEALEQIELADRIGIDYVWAVEHRFLEEYCHCAAPEVLLAAASQRTQNIRLGHGIMLTAPRFNHPARVAERIATLDHVSDGRVEFGTGEATSDIELDGFNISRETKRAAWEEGLRAAVAMMTDDIYAGHEGEHLSMPRRSVVPKPYQKPHPPLWVACNRGPKIAEAAQLGLGALNFSFGVRPELATRYATTYADAMRDRCEPLGKTINANLAVVTGFACTNNTAEAQEAFKAMKFFQHAINFYFNPGQKMPANIDLRESFGDGMNVANVDHADPASLGIFGPPASVAESLKAYEASGVDQVILLSQVGGYPHDKIMASLELFGREILPGIKERDRAHEAKRLDRLASLSAEPVA
jgi:alkanesulfonate monooxygenase SsuD/methylene tetrahydromethanopterin reductase-like flavin-dependent oxidoreductase (luciferase family)